MSFNTKALIAATVIIFAAPAFAQTPNGTATPAGPAIDKGTGPSDTGMNAGEAPMAKSTMMKPLTAGANAQSNKGPDRTGGEGGSHNGS